MKKSLLCIITVVAASFGAESQAEEIVNRAMLGMFQPLPDSIENPKNPFNDAKLQLGQQLFFDRRLSLDHTISCHSCHSLKLYGQTGTSFPTGISDQKPGRNSPTVFNAAIHIAQFWDGREPDVEAQAKGPILAGAEMGMPSGDYAVKVLKSIPGYVDLFKKAFPDSKDSLTYDNVGNAIGAYERKLMTPSRFDDFLKGDDSALSDAEKKGLNTFISTGCTTCHNGMGVGGHLFQKLGLVKAWPNLKDKGRSEVTGKEVDKFYFKVPSLRNITETSPYLHDGSVKELDVMVKKMAEYQLGRMISDEDTQSIVTFLKSLKGDLPKDLIKRPELPKSGPDTPKPKEYIVK
ncbi:MAG: c-type cytochrome [Verrucomicrobiales bacterium]|nr:c-type cytochrome [Verrucomicrobiales bacterium]